MTETNTDYEALENFSISVFTINGLLIQSGDYVTRPLGQSSARWQVLGRAGYKPQTVSSMARDIGNSRQSVQRIADALVKEGLAEYRDNPTDKRANLLAATTRGRQVLGAISKRDEKWSAGLMQQLDPGQLSLVADKLNDVSKVLEDYMKTKGDKI